ncbi:hypothetical protein IE077_001688 [Cardiosporidium cionae]|uniref:Uncharacterized protein n=1 Tax=Cardiosporidium cionae TaxID=476202 RepID=A0ABQ7J520_9APIC|nr:hypothetical protein IE077_001688 [Cardiosporidium cionae]|eukprot:KAF8819092.1 hypothetical protein IE077_001688 [Cardiosporidium cionae]
MNQIYLKEMLEDCVAHEEARNSLLEGEEACLNQSIEFLGPCFGGPMKEFFETTASRIPKSPLVSDFSVHCLDVDEAESYSLPLPLLMEPASPMAFPNPKHKDVGEAAESADTPSNVTGSDRIASGNGLPCNHGASTDSLQPTATSFIEKTEISLAVSTGPPLFNEKISSLLADEEKSELLLDALAHPQPCNAEEDTQHVAACDNEKYEPWMSVSDEKRDVEHPEASTDEATESNGPCKKWYPGFNLQLGQHGRKAFLGLIRSTYRKYPEHCGTVLDNYSPRSSISRLPYFNIKDLWELSWRFNEFIPGMWDKAIRIHDEYGKINTKRSPPLRHSHYRPSKLQKLDFSNVTHMSPSVSSEASLDTPQKVKQQRVEPIASPSLSPQAQVKREVYFKKETFTPIRFLQETPVGSLTTSALNSLCSVSSRATTAPSPFQSPNHVLVNHLADILEKQDHFIPLSSSPVSNKLPLPASTPSPKNFLQVTGFSISTPVKVSVPSPPFCLYGGASWMKGSCNGMTPMSPIQSSPSYGISQNHGVRTSLAENGSMSPLKHPEAELNSVSCVSSSNMKSRSGRKISRPLRFQECENSSNHSSSSHVSRHTFSPLVEAGGLDISSPHTTDELVEKPTDSRQTSPLALSSSEREKSSCIVGADTSGSDGSSPSAFHEDVKYKLLQLHAFSLPSITEDPLHLLDGNTGDTAMGFFTDTVTNVSDKSCLSFMKREMEKQSEPSLPYEDGIERSGSASTHDECSPINEKTISLRRFSSEGFQSKFQESEQLVTTSLLSTKQEASVQACPSTDEIDIPVENTISETSNVEITRIESSQQLFELAVQNKGFTIVDMSNYLPASCYSNVIILRCGPPLMTREARKRVMNSI